MDFSIFDKTQIPLNEECEIIVVDFVNKRTLLRTKINNLAPENPQQQQQIAQSLELAQNIKEEFIKNQVSSPEGATPSEKLA